MFFHPKNLKSENNNPWFKPWCSILLHTQSIVCATVDSQCLEYLGCITLDMFQEEKKFFVTLKSSFSLFFMRKPPFIRTWRIYHFPSFLFIGFVSTRLACRGRKKHVSCCKSKCMWKYLLLLSGAYCLEAVRASCNLHYGHINKKDSETKLFLNLKKYASWRSHAIADILWGFMKFYIKVTENFSSLSTKKKSYS